jgi:hypothetical protein
LLTSGTNFTYQERSPPWIKAQQCSVSTMTWQDYYPIRPWINKQLSYSMAINESQWGQSMAFHIIKNIGILAQAWHYNQSAHHFLPCFTLHRSFTVISSHFQEEKKHLSKTVDTILPRSDGIHSRGHTRAMWESCV